MHYCYCFFSLSLLLQRLDREPDSSWICEMLRAPFEESEQQQEPSPVRGRKKRRGVRSNNRR